MQEFNNYRVLWLTPSGTWKATKSVPIDIARFCQSALLEYNPVAFIATNDEFEFYGKPKSVLAAEYFHNGLSDGHCTGE